MLFSPHNKRYKNQIIHFIGIGGIGISGIAIIMHNLGYVVQGSDLIENSNTERLKSLGIKVFFGNTATNIYGASYVVISSDVKADNPEVLEALNHKIPVITRAEMLAELLRLKYTIAVAGSHGKTTTTSLIAHLFENAGLNPTVINGGIINDRLTNAYLGSGDYLIAEADESDETFINIPSTIGIITNIDQEHLNFYQSFDNLVEAFKTFITKLPFYGFAIACLDHEVVRTMIKTINTRKIITYGINSADANVIAFNLHHDIGHSSFDVRISLPNIIGSTTIENINIPIPGRHNVLNALAAIAVAAELDFGIQVIKNGFQGFQGVKRRFTKVGEYKGATIIDDYAHHPVEISATLETARIVANKTGGKVIAIFQPHRYSRLQHLFNDFVNCFKQADYIYITDIYSAGEKPIEDISSELLVQRIKEITNKTVEYLASYNDIIKIIPNIANKNDLVVMMGAGNISSWAYDLSSLKY